MTYNLWYTTKFGKREAFTDGSIICVGIAPGKTYGHKEIDQTIIALIPKKPHPALRRDEVKSPGGLKCIYFGPHCHIDKKYIALIESKFPHAMLFLGNVMTTGDRILIAKDEGKIVALVAPVHWPSANRA